MGFGFEARSGGHRAERPEHCPVLIRVRAARGTARGWGFGSEARSRDEGDRTGMESPVLRYEVHADSFNPCRSLFPK
jgi:hypothetical protein